jgi:hypothetical protein
MDSVEHPLDWWAYGGYPAVRRELGYLKTEACHRVHQKFREYSQGTGDPGWRPVGNHDEARLRRAIVDGRVLNHDLI